MNNQNLNNVKLDNLLDNVADDNCVNENVADDNCVNENVVDDNCVKDNRDNEEDFEIDDKNNISIGLPDVLFTLTINRTAFENDVKHLAGKIMIPRELRVFNLQDLSNALNVMKIYHLNIICINKYSNGIVKNLNIEKPSSISYIEVGFDSFKEIVMEKDGAKFRDYNRDTLYILKDSSYIDVKNLLVHIEGFDISVGKGSSQKAHILSPLDIRLTTYVMAIYNFDHRYINYINTFNDIPKDRYLPFFEKSYKSKTIFPKKYKYRIPFYALSNNYEKFDKFWGKYYPKKTSIGETYSNNKFIRKYSTWPIFSKLNRNIPIRKYHTKSVKTDSETNISVYSYLDQIDEIINNSSSFFEAQREIERSWINLMKKKLEDPSISTWRILPQLIKKSVVTLEKHEKTGILKKRFKLINSELSNNKYEVILLTIAMLISNYSKMSATNISIQIGHNIAFLLFKQNLVENESVNFRSKFEEWKKIRNLDSNVKLLRLGDYFINLFTNEPTQIFEFTLDEEDSVDTTCERIIKISPEYIDEIKDVLIIHPTSLPMICEPIDWSDNNYGGFIENKYNQEPINTGSSYHGHKIENKEPLYKSVNILNKIKFNVNKELLDYLLNDGKFLLEDDENMKKNFQNNITLKVATIYSKFEFYLNVNSDWRTRLYTNSFFLSYQGSDLSRSLIEFADGEKLTEEGLKYLYIFGANCYSNLLGKKSITYRIAWVKKNLNKITQLDKEFINKANKKIQFVSFCIAIKNYELDNNFLVKLPVFLDATCSGLQHLAAMLQDINLATHVNLLSKSDNDEVNDLYESMVVPINTNINKFGKENASHSLLTNVELNRKLLKPSIMTQVYSVTIKGIFRQLTKKFKKKSVMHPTEKNIKGKPIYNTFYYVPAKKNKEILLSFMDVYKIAEIIKNAAFDIYPSLREIYSYFMDTAKLTSELKIPLVWFTPNGMEIYQFYYTSKVNKVTLSYFGKTRTSVLRDWEPIVNKTKQNQSIIPNIIHSMDASHLINVINHGNDKNIAPIISIHDCFGTLPNKMGNLVKLVTTQFVLIYTQENFLEKYNEKVINTIKDNNYKIIEKNNNKYVVYSIRKERKDGTVYFSKEKLYLIPTIPKMGDLNIEEIVNAKYLIN